MKDDERYIDNMIDEIEEAVNTYIKHGDNELDDMCKAIRSIYRKYGGDIDDDEQDEEDGDDNKINADDKNDISSSNNNIPFNNRSSTTSTVRHNKKNMDINDLSQLMEELTTQLLASTDDFCGSFIAKNGIPSSKSDFEQFQVGLMTISQR